MDPKPIRLYRGADNTMRPLEEHLKYMERCAVRWELEEKSPKQAALVRAMAERIKREAEEVSDDY